MLRFLSDGIRKVLGLLDETEADLAEVEERLANFAERTERAEFQLTELGERFLAMVEPASRPANRLKAVAKAGRNSRKATRNGKASRRRATAKKR